MSVIVHGHCVETCFEKLVTSQINLLFHFTEVVVYNAKLFNYKDPCYLLLYFPFYSGEIKNNEANDAYSFSIFLFIFYVPSYSQKCSLHSKHTAYCI